MQGMRRRGVRLLFLLWLGWYLSGPLFETIDRWDSPREEISDVARSAGGATTLLAVLVSFGIALFRRLQDRGLVRTVLRGNPFASASLVMPVLESSGAPAFAHSPPCCLRI